MSDIEFVKAKDKDFAYLLSLRKETMVPHLEQAGLFLTDEDHKARVLYEYAASHIIYLNGRPIGLAKFKPDGQQYQLFQLQIEPRMQGKGFGSKVINTLLSRFADKDWTLTVLKQNPAKRLYEQSGFVTFDEDEHEFHMRYNMQQAR
ncbi:GNAT family N-acetyltransferase [Pseudoalteromonas sp. T1lg65]|uniref:GNAT family N-acetyltransferase n=1 Tax=Pseudoalteromonas sp. T1lg65 TaxID=2077101 RepID=UPI003F78E137